MRNLSRLASATALAAALTLPFAMPVSAGEKSQDIVVRSQAAMEKWQQTTTKQLNRMLARAPVARSHAPNETIVQVAFTIDAEGNPENIKVLDGDANWGARQAAVYAVKRLDSLSDVPVRNPEGAKFLANLIFAQDRETYRELAATLKPGGARFAEADDEEYILLGG